MERTLGKEYADPIVRRTYIKDNCDGVVEMGYMKPFASEKVVELKEKLAETSIEIGEVEAEKKASAVYFKVKLKPLQEEQASIIRGIKERAEYVKEECYKYVDQDEKMVGFYNADGDLIESRPAHPDELQGTIYQLGRKTGTND